MAHLYTLESGLTTKNHDVKEFFKKHEVFFIAMKDNHIIFSAVCGPDCLRTSTVMSCKKLDNGYVCIKTRNTTYHLTVLPIENWTGEYASYLQYEEISEEAFPKYEEFDKIIMSPNEMYGCMGTDGYIAIKGNHLYENIDEKYYKAKISILP